MAPAADREPHALAGLSAALHICLDDERRPMRYADLRGAVIRALIRRARTFSEIADEAVALVGYANRHTIEDDCRGFVRFAFNAPYEGGRLSPEQRRLLGALVANDECWAFHSLTARLDEAGLPTERDLVRDLAQGQ